MRVRKPGGGASRGVESFDHLRVQRLGRTSELGSAIGERTSREEPELRSVDGNFGYRQRIQQEGGVLKYAKL